MSFLILFASVMIVLAVGLLLGFIISLASHFLSVPKEERIEQIEELLPGANCGACGFAGCAAYAEAIVLNGAPLTRCTSLNADGLQQIGEIMGQKVEAQAEPEKAFIACHAAPFDKEATQFLYGGLADCNSRALFYKGPKKCKYGCLGGGSCIEVCPVNAIYRNKRNRVVIDRKKCISCRKCLEVCPMNVIRMIPESANYAVACSHPGKGVQTKADCGVGCLGCSLCVKNSPEGGFFMDGFLAKIDYACSGDRAKAAEKCPVHCIVEIK